MLVDADVILRFLTNDDPKKAERFEAFLSSGRKARLSDVTFAEIYWTLRSFYKFPKKKIIATLEHLLHTDSLVCERDVLYATLDILGKQTISFIDAYNAAFSLIMDDKCILSFDRDFDRLSDIKRVEP